MPLPENLKEKSAVESTPSNSVVKISDDEYPQGKLKAWSTLIGASLMQLCAMGILSSYGVFQDFYLSTWLSNYSPSTISWIGSTQIFLQYSIGPIAGELLDRGYFRSLVITGSAIYVASLVSLSFTRQNHFVEIFLSQAIGMGLGIGLVFLPISVVPIRHFRKKQSLSMGIVDSTISLGGVIFSVSLNYLIHGHIGFAWGIRIISLITLVCFVVGIFTMSMPDLPSGGNSSTDARTTWKTVILAARGDWPFIFSLAQAFVMTLGTFVPSFYLQVFAVQHDIDKIVSFYALSVLNFSSIFGRVVSCYYGDMYSVLEIYAPCLVITGGLSFAMLGASTTAGLFSFAICYGFFFGATNGLYLPLINSISYRKPTHLWKRCGMSLLPPAISALVGLPITGAILGPDLIWWKGVAFASITILAATILVLFSIICFRRNEKKIQHSGSVE